MPFPIADTLTVLTRMNFTAPRWLFRQVRYVVYLLNSIITQYVGNSFDYGF